MRPCLVVTCLSVMIFTAGCRDDEGPIKEPIVTEDSNTTYGEDPDLGSANNRGQNTANNRGANDADEIVADPFAADAPPIVDGNENLIASATPDNENGLVEMDEVYGNALTDNHEVDKRDLELFPEKHEDPRAPAKSKKKKLSKKSKRQHTAADDAWWYVKPILLNVRSGPSLKAPIVRRLLGGARIKVTTGHPRGFVKIRKGQYVRAKYLTRTPQKRVTRAQAERAWKQQAK